VISFEIDIRCKGYAKCIMRSVLLFAVLLFAVDCTYKSDCSALDVSCSPSGALLLFSAPPMVIATGTSCQGWYSTNFTAWTSFLFPGCTAGTISGVAYGNGTFVAVGSTTGSDCGVWTSTAAYKPDWQMRSCGTIALPMTAVAFGSGSAGSEFVAAGSLSGVNFAGMSSPDGITWSDASLPGATSGSVSSVIFSSTAQKFLASHGSPQMTRGRIIGGGTSWSNLNATGVLSPRIALGPLISGNIRIVNYGNSPTVVQYSDDNFATGTNNYSPNVFGTLGTNVNDHVYGDGKRMVFVRNSCGVTYSTSDSGADTSGNYTMSACGTSNLSAVGYLDPYFIAGSDDGSFYISRTGFPTDWIKATSSASTSTTQHIAGRPGF